MSNRRHCDDRSIDVRNKNDLQTTVEPSRAADNWIGGEINVRAPQIDAHVGAIESKFGSFGVDSSVGLRTGASLGG